MALRNIASLLNMKKSVITMGNQYRVNFPLFCRNVVSQQLVFEEFGNPLDVLKVQETEIYPLGDKEVLVRMLAAPVNPADINLIEGKYPVKMNLPSVPGSEGVGIVEEVGKDVHTITAGNKVILVKPVQGTWRTMATFEQDALRVVPDKLGVIEAATLLINPCTAYRMLTDFEPLKREGLVVIQNGGNSACGQYITQLCKAWNVKNINIVRNRPEINELKKTLKGLGATYVLTDEELSNTTIFKEKKIDKPYLALNCVGGKSLMRMLKHMQHSGKVVTYGGMSRKPVTIPTSAFIFKNISFLGFWMTAWYENANQTERDEMIDNIIYLFCENKLKGPIHKMISFKNYEEAVDSVISLKGYIGHKFILDLGCML